MARPIAPITPEFLARLDPLLREARTKKREKLKREYIKQLHDAEYNAYMTLSKPKSHHAPYKKPPESDPMPRPRKVKLSHALTDAQRSALKARLQARLEELN